jgi:hypothetical protein
MRATVLAIIMTVLAGHYAQGGLWETRAQIERRYGRSLEKFTSDRGEEQRKYRYKQFFILVTLVGGKSEEEYYFHQDKTPFSQQEINSFLSMNSGGKPWQRTSKLPIWFFGGPSAETSKALAAYYPRSKEHSVPGLTVSTIEAADRTMGVAH